MTMERLAPSRASRDEPAPIDKPSAGNGEDQDVNSQPASIGRKFMSWQTLASFAIGVVILAFVFRGLDIDLKDSWRQMRQANPALFLLALVTYYLSMLMRAWRWTRMLSTIGLDRKHNVPIPNLLGMFQIFVLSWFANSAVPARLGDVYRSYLLKRRSGASISLSLGTMLAERLIDLVVLVGVLFVSGLIVFGTHAPQKSEQAFVIGLGVVLLGVIGLIVLWFLRDHLERLLPDRVSRHYRRVQRSLFRTLSNPAPFALMSVGIWMLDGLRVFFVARSLGQDISYQAAVMVALISALVSIIPITPAGLGVVEGFMVKALTEIGVGASAAAAVALLDRVITYLSIMAFGIPLYIWVMRRDIKDNHAGGD